jgi:hypothetical protein
MLTRPLLHSRIAVIAPWLVAILIPLLVYGSALSFGFVYDDAELIVHKSAPQSLTQLLSLFNNPYFEGLPYYRPIPASLFALERLSFGLNPVFYHLTNVSLVCALSALLYHLFTSPFFGFSKYQGLLLALLAVLHPISSSAVYLLSGREALLAAIFATLVIARLINQHGHLDIYAAIALLLALLSRESSVFLLPLICLIIMVNIIRRSPAWRVFTDIILLSLSGLLYAMLRLNALRDQISTPQFNSDLALFPASYLYALTSILFPSSLLQYEPDLMEWFSTGTLLAVLVVVCAVLIMLQKFGAYRSFLLPVVLSVFFLSLAPTANIFIQETPFDERHLLMALLATTALFGWLVIRVAEKFSISAALIILPLLLVLTTFTVRRGATFSSDEAFLQRWVESAPQQAKVVCFQALQALLNQDYQAALSFANRSITLRENNLALLYRARAYLQLGDLEAARRDLIRSIEMDPKNIDVLCEQALLAGHSGESAVAEKLFTEIEKRNSNIWCLGGRDRRESYAFWGAGLSLSQKQLLSLPLTSREQLRGFYLVQPTRR